MSRRGIIVWDVFIGVIIVFLIASAFNAFTDGEIVLAMIFLGIAVMDAYVIAGDVRSFFRRRFNNYRKVPRV